MSTEPKRIVTRFWIGGLLALILLVVTTWMVPGRAGRPALGDETARAQPDEDAADESLRQVEDFALSDYRGREYTLPELFEERDYLVIAFLGTECPLMRFYGPRLNDLAAEFEAEGVGFVGINANVHDSVTEIGAYVRRHGVTFPMLKDVGNVVADQMEAVRTPEVFVVDRERRVRYHGRIDDQYGVSYVRDEPRREDLRQALTQLLAGETPEVTRTEAVGCFIGRIPTPDASSEVTYSRQISRILQRNCVECHREGQIAPFELTEYDEVVGWAETIAEVVEQRRMPPWHADPQHGEFSNARTLTPDEEQLIYRWVAAGAPEGDPEELPEPVEFTDGWLLPKIPDLVIPIADEPVDVQAEGAVEYKYFRVDPGFTEDTWVRGIELQPGNRAVVHHILVFAVGGAGGREFDGGVRGFLGGYVPGMLPPQFPEGMAKRIPAGSRLVFQVHYTPIGTPQQDLSRVGFVFADPEEVTYEIQTISAFQRWISIPPRTDDYEARASTFVDDTLLLGMMPHMHLRGSAFRYEAFFPDGTTEVLLDVPRYDFNWQTSYRLETPRELPAGTRIACLARYDNSEENLNNPDHRLRVGWGEQTWDEMMIGYFDIARPRGAAEESRARSRASRLVQMFDRDGDGFAQSSELPLRLRLYFGRIDANEDGKLSVDEVEELGAELLERVG